MIRLAIPVSSAVYARVIAPRAEAILREFATWEPNPEPGELSEDELVARVDGVDGMIVSWEPITRRILDAAPSLRIIGKLGTAVGHIDLQTCFERGIVVANAPEGYAEAVSEFTLAMILAALRNLPRLEVGLHRDGIWDNRAIGEELSGKSIGVIGLGAIGRRLIALLGPFGCQIILHSRHATAAEAAALGARLATLDEVCQSEVLCLTGALTTASEGLIDATALARLPDNALIVNTARARIVDDASLLAELQSGRLRAALDVYPSEPLAADSPLRALPNVLLFPHRAGATYQAYARVGTTVAESLRSFFQGNEPATRVTPAKLAYMTPR